MKGRKEDRKYKITAVFIAAALLMGSGAGMPVTVWAQENVEIQENQEIGETKEKAENVDAETLSENSGEPPAEETQEVKAEEEKKHWVTWMLYVEGNYSGYPFETYPQEVKAVNKSTGEEKEAYGEDYMDAKGYCRYWLMLKNGTYEFCVDGEKLVEITLDDTALEEVKIEPSWTYYGVWFCDDNGERPMEMCYVKSGQTASPQVPGRPGHIFDGWVKTPGGNDKFDLSTPITESIKLYASWKEDDTTSTVTGEGWSLTKEGVLTIDSNQGMEHWAANGQSKYKQRVTSANIDSSVTKIAKSAFEDCLRLTNVVMSPNVTVLEDDAFNCCESLSSVEIPSGVTKIGDGAFFMCGAMKSVTIPENVEQIGSYAFRKSGLTSVRIPARVTKILPGTFWECSDLQSVEITGGVTEIGWDAFRQSGLRSVRIPANVKKLSERAFSECEKLTTVEIEEGLTEIGGEAFSKSGLTSVVMPSSVTTIGGASFSFCRSLTEVKLSENLTKIGTMAFAGSALTSVVIPDSVTMIDILAFALCASLEKVIMKSKTPPAMEAAFEMCGKMKKGSIIVPKGTAKTYKAAEGWLAYQDFIVEETSSGSSGNDDKEQGGKDQGDQGQGNQSQGDGQEQGSQGSGNSGQGGSDGQSGSRQSTNGSNAPTASAEKTESRSSGIVGRTGGKAEIAAAKGDDTEKSGIGKDGDGAVEIEKDVDMDAENSNNRAVMEQDVEAGSTGAETDGSLTPAILLGGVPDGDAEAANGAVSLWCGAAVLLLLLLIGLLYLADRRYGIIAKIRKTGQE